MTSIKFGAISRSFGALKFMARSTAIGWASPHADTIFMLVRMALARIVIVDSDDDKMSMIVLRELDGERAFPILIGVHEAYAIDRRTRGIGVPRPMTHDLIGGILGKLDCQIEHIVISELRNSTFYAKLILRRNGELIEIDSRPSDAIAVGAGTDVPIFVDDAILREVC